jgi:hypothetical protein
LAALQRHNLPEAVETGTKFVGDADRDYGLLRGRITSASSLARKHRLSIGRGLDFASPHYHGKTPYTYQILFRRHIRPVIEKISGIKSSKEAPNRMAYATPVASDIADLKRGECQSRTVTASAHNPKDYAGTLRTSGFSRSAGSPQEGRANGASGEVFREVEARSVTTTA